MTPSRTWLFLACFFCMAMTALADSTNSEFLVTRWRNEEGLPHSTINSILQTRDGYLWLGTYVGLVRFDGVRFVQYSSINVPDLEAGGISYLFEDRDGTMWVSLETGRLLAWKDGAPQTLLSGADTNHHVISMAQQSNGVIWVKTLDGALGRVTGKEIEFVSPPSTEAAPRNLGLVVDADDQLWVGTTAGLRLWKNGALVAPRLDPIDKQPIEAITRARDGAIWIFCRQQLWKVRGGKILEQMPALEGFDEVTGILEASDGKFWLGSAQSSLYCRKPGGAWQEIPDSSFQGLIRLLYEDREGNLWRGGFGGGLTRIRPRIFTAHDPPEARLNRYARTVCADSAGNVWAVLDGEILSRIPAGAQTPQAILYPSNPHNIKTMLFDHHDSLWVGADGGDVYRLKGESFAHELNLGPGIDYVSALFEDAAGNLWIGYTGGAGVAMLPGGDPAKWHALAGMPYPDVRAIAQSPDGSMWFGTHYGGAFRWQQGKWSRLTTHDGLPSDYVRCLLADADGSMWFGTLHGLCRWRAGKLSTITSAQGLWNDSISHIADDGRGNLWISSFHGVFRVKRADLNDFADGRLKMIQCVGYDQNDGLANVECTGGFQPAGAKTPDGRLWIPTAGGLVSLSLKTIPQNKVPPPVWLEGVTIDDKLTPVNHSTSSVTIPPGGRRLDFRFTGLSFTAPEKVLFRHMLEGLDNDWSPPDKQRTVTYNYIPPGNYTFKVMARNDDGLWNTNGQSLQLQVQPFFWQTWWFKTFVALSVATILIWGVRRVERWKARIRLERLESDHAVERERSRIAKDIHDDLGANLTQIVFLSQRVEGAGHDPAEVERWNRLIPATASRTIQSLDEIVWAINPKHDTLESLANYLSRFAHEFLSLAAIRCDLDIPTVLPSVPLGAEVRHNLVLTAREALQNIVTHAAATEVRVTLRLDESALTVELADNGRGFSAGKDDAGGNGLSNMRKRLEDIGGNLNFSGSRDSGTTVTFSVPRKRLHGRVIDKPFASIKNHENGANDR